MKKNLNKKILLFFIVFLFLLIINTSKSFALEGVEYNYSNIKYSFEQDTYNTSYIDSYLEVGQSPFEAFGKIVDYFHNKNPESIKVSSDDLPEKAVMFKMVALKGENNETTKTYYMFYFSDGVVLPEGNQTSWGNAINSNVARFYPQGSIDFIGVVGPSGVYFRDAELNNITYGNLYFTSFVYAEDVYISASTYDIMDKDGINVVFHQPTLGKVTTLAPVVNKVEMSPVLKEIIAILPLILVVVVSLIGLRKALKMLSQLLHRS